MERNSSSQLHEVTEYKPLFTGAELAASTRHIPPYRDVESRTGIPGGFSGRLSEPYYMSHLDRVMQHETTGPHFSHYIKPRYDGTVDAEQILRSLPPWKRRYNTYVPTPDIPLRHRGLNLPETDLRWIANKPDDGRTRRPLSIQHYTGSIKDLEGSGYARYLYDRYFLTYGPAMADYGSDRSRHREAMYSIDPPREPYNYGNCSRLHGQLDFVLAPG